MSDVDRCLHCDYSLAGLALARCPECGAAVDRDGPPVLLFRRGLIRSLPGVLWSVMWRPTATLGLCRWRRAVPGRDAAGFALAFMALVILGWPIIRRLLSFVALSMVWGPAGAARAELSAATWGRLGNVNLWMFMLSWHVGAVLRWWVLFGLIAMVWAWRTPRRGSAERGRMADMACRLALFTPWIVVIEVGYLVGVWVAEGPQVVPEPSTVFMTRWRWDNWLRTVWLVRGVAPTLGVGYVFFRAVIGMRWWTALIGAVVLIPIAINLSLGWSWVWVHVVAPMLP
jgi:hypothetical protein